MQLAQKNASGAERCVEWFPMFTSTFTGHGCCFATVVVHVGGDCANVLIVGIYANNAGDDVAEPGLFYNHAT